MNKQDSDIDKIENNVSDGNTEEADAAELLSGTDEPEESAKTEEDPSSEHDRKDDSENSKTFGFWLLPRNAEGVFEMVEVFATAFTIVIILFTFAVRMVTVEGPSMLQTLRANDNLVIQLFFTPQQNDIVVIQVPNSTFHAPIIKRVIATEGQQVDFDFENWVVYVDGIALDEPYVNRVFGQPMRSDSILLEQLPITVEPGKIFVLGDNRNSSSDSRSASIGQVDVRNVVGRVMFRVFPLPNFGRVG